MKEYVEFPSFYQYDAVEFLLNKKRALIQYDTGTGKTAIGIAGKYAIDEKNGRRTKSVFVVPNLAKVLWEQYTNEYSTTKPNILVLNNYTVEELHRINDPNIDFVISGYEVFGTKRGKEITEKLLNSGIKYGVFDENQYIKNPNARRSPHLLKLGQSLEYLALLSATPHPEGLWDTFMLICLLEPQYKTPEEVRERHLDQPDLIRAILKRKTIKRDALEVMHLPPITYNTNLKGVLELNEEQRELYDAVFDNDDLEGTQKLGELRKAILDPSLVNPEIIYDPLLRGKLNQIPSPKYQALDKIIEERIKDGKKIVIFSPIHRTGVLTKLEKRYRHFGALRIDGTIQDLEEREKIRDEFQNHSDKNILLATTATTGKSISLNAASTVVFLEDVYSFDEKKQALSRVWRRGQENPVEVISLAVKNSIDEGVLELIDLKREGNEYLDIGRQLKPEHYDVLLRGLSSSPIRRRLYSPQQRIRIYASRMSEKGSVAISRALQRKNQKIARDYAENYIKNWETSYSANTARAYKQIIETLESLDDLSRKLDLASGPGVLSHILNEPTTNVDINEKHFEQNFAHPQCKNIVTSFHNLKPYFADGSFDLALLSLGLNYTSNRIIEGKETTERQDAVLEVNRVLRHGGYFTLTLPDSNVTAEVHKNISNGLKTSGFETIPELTGFVRSATPDVDFQVYILNGRKIGDSSKVSTHDDFELAIDKKYPYTMRKKGIADEFLLIEPETQSEIPLKVSMDKYLARRRIEDSK